MIKWQRSRGKDGEKSAFTFEELKRIAKGKTQAELRRENPQAYDRLIRDPRRNEIKKVMKFGNGGTLLWTDEAIEKEVRGKYAADISKGALRRLHDHPRKEYFRSLMKRKYKQSVKALAAKKR